MINFDGIPGPTHNYAGLARGNLAAEKNARQIANPREAALQGLAKMRALAARGFAQAVLPPHERPDVFALRALGFIGSDADIIRRAAIDAPQILAACSSAAAMWAANAATVSPSADTARRPCPFHTGEPRQPFPPRARSTDDHPRAARDLRRRRPFRRPRSVAGGAASRRRRRGKSRAPVREGGCARRRDVRLRACGLRHECAGAAAIPGPADPRGFRRDRAAPRSRSRAHGVRAAEPAGDRRRRLPQRRDRGRLRHRSLLPRACLLESGKRCSQSSPPKSGRRSRRSSSPPREVSVADAVATYLFNSQLLPRPDGRLLLVAPAECRSHQRVSAYMDRLLASGGPIAEVLTFDLRQSMRNGGGPACLRLSVPLTADERSAIGARVMLDDTLAAELDAWIRRSLPRPPRARGPGRSGAPRRIAPRARRAHADPAPAADLRVSAQRALTGTARPVTERIESRRRPRRLVRIPQATALLASVERH